MTISYHPGEPFRALYTRHVLRTVSHPMYISTIIMFIAIRAIVAFTMTAETAKQMDLVFTYPATLVGTLFAFLIGFFVNNWCARRFYFFCTVPAVPRVLPVHFS